MKGICILALIGFFVVASFIIRASILSVSVEPMTDQERLALEALKVAEAQELELEWWEVRDLVAEIATKGYLLKLEGIEVRLPLIFPIQGPFGALSPFFKKYVNFVEALKCAPNLGHLGGSSCMMVQDKNYAERSALMSKPRVFAPEFKAQVVLEVLSGAKTAAEACREYHLKSETLSKWRAHFLENAPKLFQTDGQRSQEQARIAELERLIGRLTLELEVAKKAFSFWNAHQSRSGR